MEKIKADASGILICVRKLKDLQKHNEMVGANIEKRSQVLELKEKELQSLSLELEERCKIFEKEKSEAGNLKKIVEASIEKRSQELELKEKELQSLSLDLEKRCELFEKEKTEAGNLKKIVEASIEKRSQELELKEKELQSWSLDLETTCKSLKKQKAEAGNLKKKVEEYTEELRSNRKQLIANMNSLTKYQRELDDKERLLGEVMAEIGRRSSEAQKLQDREREIEGETNRKKKKLALILAQIKESGKQRQLKMRSLELVCKEKELECVKESIKLSKSDLELKEKKVQSLNNCITVCGQEIDSKSKELGEIQKMIEQQTGELGVINNQVDLAKLFIRELSKELDTKEKRHKEILETIYRSSSEIEEKAKEIKVAEAEASGLYARSQRFRKEVEDKEKELDLLTNQIESEEKKLIQLKREMKEETDRKKKDLELILDQIKQSGKQFVTVDEQLESRQKLLKIRSSELDSKEKELERVKESIKLSKTDLELKEKKMQSFNNYITVCVGSKSKELVEIQKLIEQQTCVLGVMNNQIDTIDKRHKEIVETIRRSSFKMEEKAKEIKEAEAEASGLYARSQRFRKEVEDKEKELNLFKNQIESEEKKLIQLKGEMEKETDRKKKDLKLILSKIEESGKQLAAVVEKLESQRRLLEIQSLELVSKDMESECVGESSKLVKFDIKVKEKRVQALNDLIKISGEQLDLKSKELEEVQKLIEEQRNELCDMQNQQPSAAPINDTSQQNAAEAEPVNEDALMHHESAASLMRDEVSSELRASPNPAEFVLDLVQEEIREGSGEDSTMEILVLLFDEFAKIQRRYEAPQLHLKAREVATLWKGKITMEAPKSSLEALAFLLFIVAYGLKKLINQEETALLASSIAQYEQAPTLFNSLGLTLMIPEFVEELIKKRQYIPAVRLICLFKLNKESSFSPSQLLKEEIINLRQSALGKRPTESSQAKDKEAGRLRAILELVADYNLEVDLPGDLVAKLIVQREKSIPLVCCSVMRLTSSSNEQALSPNPVSAQRSVVNIRVPKHEVKTPYFN